MSPSILDAIVFHRKSLQKHKHKDIRYQLINWYYNIIIIIIIIPIIIIVIIIINYHYYHYYVYYNYYHYQLFIITNQKTTSIGLLKIHIFVVQVLLNDYPISNGDMHELSKAMKL